MHFSSETQYFIDCSVTIGHIGADTGLWFLSQVQNPDLLLSQASQQAKRLVGNQNHLLTLATTGTILEEAYTNWRRTTNTSLVLSLAALENAPQLFDEIVGTCSNYLLDNNIGHNMESVFDDLDGKYNITNAMHILRNSVVRANHDLGNLESKNFGLLKRDLTALHEGIYQHNVQIHMSDFENNSFKNSSKHRIKWRNIQRATRKAIRRSSELLSTIAGEDTTRMFLSEGRIVVEGKNFLYEIKRGRSLAHGGAGPGMLKILDKKDPTIVLCDMCVLSPGVPMMDHVGSLILHIRSGLEKEIFQAGNIGYVNKLAYENEFLIPFLPEKRVREVLTSNQSRGPVLGFESGSFFAPARPSLQQVKETRYYVGHWIFERTIASWADLITRARHPIENNTNGVDGNIENLYQRTILLPHEQGYENGLLQVSDAYCYGDGANPVPVLTDESNNNDQTIEITDDESSNTSSFRF